MVALRQLGVPALLGRTWGGTPRGMLARGRCAPWLSRLLSHDSASGLYGVAVMEGRLGSFRTLAQVKVSRFSVSTPKGAEQNTGMQAER